MAPTGTLSFYLKTETLTWKRKQYYCPGEETQACLNPKNPGANPRSRPRAGRAKRGLTLTNASSLWLPPRLLVRRPYAGPALLRAPPRPRLFPLRGRNCLQTRKRVSWSRGQSVECEFRLSCLNLRLAVPPPAPGVWGPLKSLRHPPNTQNSDASMGGRGLPFGFEIREVGPRPSRPLEGSAGRPSGEAGPHLGREILESSALPGDARTSPHPAFSSAVLCSPGLPPVRPRLSSPWVGEVTKGLS